MSTQYVRSHVAIYNLLVSLDFNRYGSSLTKYYHKKECGATRSRLLL